MPLRAIGIPIMIIPSVRNTVAILILQRAVIVPVVSVRHAVMIAIPSLLLWVVGAWVDDVGNAIMVSVAQRVGLGCHDANVNLRLGGSGERWDCDSSGNGRKDGENNGAVHDWLQ